ncbi:DUF1007 family protein [Paraburkholderia dilworthii]|uniref:DUF1007 family protein n=1 Tax=Paraburkholderia dilworthii TaxID=948106 RepID=UPI000A02EB2F|nr:DUF1007 family protein [Paraburkholderia dilworthii]
MRNRVTRALHERVLPFIRAVAAACFSVAAAPLAAHPHVWITYASVARMDGSALSAVQEKWTFSQGFPVSVVGDLTGMPKSGPLSPKYTRIFRQQAFDSLKGTGYFTHVFVDGKAAHFGEVRDFAVSIEGGRIVYTFVLPLADKVDLKRAQVQLGIWDETFFVDFQALSKSGAPIVFDATAEKTCTAQAFEDKVHAIFGGAIFPLSTRLSC